MKIIFANLIILLLLFTSCTRDRSLDQNTFNYPLSGQISTLDPANSYDSISMAVVNQAYEPLYEYHYLLRPYKIIPLLADGMPKIENNGTRYTIKIKEGVRYHDSPAFKGKPRFVKAQDFVNQIKRLAFKPLRSNGWWLFDSKIKGLNKFRELVGSDYDKLKSLSIEGLKTPDDRTLIIELEKPFPQMIYALTMSFVAPIPVEAMDHFNNSFDNTIIGTGPYKLKKWVRGSKLMMEKFEHFHPTFYPSRGDRLANSKGLLKDAGKRLPFIDKVNFHIITEAQTRWLQFRAQKIDFLKVTKDYYHAAVSDTGELNKEFKDAGIKLNFFTTLTFWWVSFNMNDKFLGENLNLRKAISHAINVEKYIQTFTNNIGLKANSIYIPGIPGYDPTQRFPYEYNLEKAKEYMIKAGFPNGKGLPEFVFDARGTSTTHRQRAEFFKAALDKIGIKIKVVVNTFPAFLKKSKEGKLQVWLDGWSLDYPDSENILQLLRSTNHPPGQNTTWYNSKKYDKMFMEMKLLPNGEKKFDYMKRMEKVIFDDLPWSMLYYARDYMLYHKRLINFRHSDLIVNKIKYLKLSK